MDGYHSPSVVNGDELRPDIVATKGNSLYILELTVEFETNISKNAERKEQKYANLIETLHESRNRNKYEEVRLVNLSLGDLGIVGKESQGLKKMLEELGLSESEEDYIVKKLIDVCTNLHILYFS